MSELAINAVCKNLIVSKIFLQKILKLGLYYQVLDFRAIFILILLLNYYYTEKLDSKKDLVEFIGLSNLEIVFILLAKAIAV